jgi:hypothetical protein
MNFIGKTLTLLLVAMLSTPVFAQESTYRLEVEQQVADSTLLIDFFIQKTSGEDFLLGSSNFAINVSHQYLDMSRMRFEPGSAGKWDRATDPKSYISMGLGGDTYVSLNVKKRTRKSGKGQPVTAVRERIGRVAIPIIDFCGKNTISWIVEPIAVNSYDLVDIKPYAEFVDPLPDFPLSDAPETPLVQIAEDTDTFCISKSLTLTTSHKGEVQWLHNGQPIAGATRSSYEASQAGQYAVRALHCIRNVDSEPVEIFVKPLPEPLTITQYYDTLTASASDNYQWYYEDQVIEGATDRRLLAVQEGAYKVQTSNACGVVASEEYNYVISGTKSVKNITKFEIHPNPSFGDAVVSYNIPEAGNVKIKVYNMQGKYVTTLTDAYYQPGEYQLPFRAQEYGYGAGVYYVRIFHKGITKTLRILEM